MENKREIGSRKERTAALFLEDQGLVLLTRNFYFLGGELDLVARDGEYLVFVEVKYRKNGTYGFPEEAVTKAKQKKLRLGARQYMYRNKIPLDTPCRFDVISIRGEKINWIQDAF